jgi:2-polyprenyl-6-methoxyphenol hydroxylase-like FAD-dependent oxidoreductase
MTPYPLPPRLPPDVPVLVAGGGPVGLAAAIELADHGVSCVVIERREEVSWLRPRAKTTSARTMEHFRRWGLADTLRDRAPLPVAWSDQAVFCTTLVGREITRFDGCFGLDLAGSDLVAECGQQVPQPVVEQTLRDAVAARDGVELFVSMQVTAVQEDADGVSVQVEDGDGQIHQVRARYVIGCEGARSVVRDAMGARYQGSDHPRPNLSIVFRAPTLAALVPHGPAVHYWVLNPSRPGLVGRLDLDETWWCIAPGVDAATSEATAEELVHELVGTDVGVNVLATDAWQARMLLADRYASEGSRLFVAGDAAHQNPPWGGHGFNTGIGDAVNLGWKLAAVINGWAPNALLASYEPERRPVAARTIDEAARNMATLSPELADVRLVGSDEEFARARPLVAEVIHTTKDREFHSLALTLGYDYRDSPIVVPESPAGRTMPAAPIADSNDDTDYHPTAAPGHRLPHRWLGSGDSLYDHLGPGLTLIGDRVNPAADQLVLAAATQGVPLSVVDLRGEDWKAHLGAALVMVRSDHHVAWRGNRCDHPEAVVACAIGKVTSPTSPPTLPAPRIEPSAIERTT